MKAHLLFFAFLNFTLMQSFAQEWKMDVAYKYMYAKQWDKAIQTYNFSRPDLIEKQPLLMNGLNASVSRSLKT